MGPMIRAARLLGFSPLVCELGGELGLRLATSQVVTTIEEKVMADPSTRDPGWLQILPSTEVAPWKRFWPAVPTFLHVGISCGTITPGRS